jgi:hypothetical protein
MEIILIQHEQLTTISRIHLSCIDQGYRLVDQKDYQLTDSRMIGLTYSKDSFQDSLDEIRKSFLIKSNGNYQEL